MTAPAEMPGVEEIRRKVTHIVESAMNSAIPEPWEVSAAASAAILALFAPILAEKERELREARSRLRWNIEDDGRLVRICEGLHEKSEDCEFDTYVPEARALAAEAALAAVKAENEAYRQNRHYVMGFNAGFEAACEQGHDAAAIRAEGE